MNNHGSAKITRIMDIVEKTRTFQDKTMTYEQLLTVINKDYDSTYHFPSVQTENKIGNIIVQYKETDW